MNAEKGKFLKAAGSIWGQRVTILVAVIVVMAIVQPRFFSSGNMLSILLAIAFYGVIASGMLFVVLIGGIDLAVGSEAALGGTIFTMYVLAHDMSAGTFFTAFLLAILVAILVGLLHGFFDAYLGMPSFVVTLATQYALYGLTQYITKMNYLPVLNASGLFYQLGNGKLFGIPSPVIWFVILAVIAAFVLKKTPYGRRIYAVGGNPHAAELVGVSSKFHKMTAYIICAVTASIAGMLLVSMNMVSSYKMAAGYEGPVLMALVIGAVNLMGGEGSMGGVFFGALLVGIINNMLILIGIDTDYKEFVQGCIIILAVAINVYTSRKSQGLVDQKRRRMPWLNRPKRGAPDG
ncbi:MAG: ABC transporter permease [Clostridiales Family XIII bacterium]|jgi:ribose/xylose/arabinose/galactoside ABC-type transport system permease subunit|nr:ABC transporter permease [Clostridiales Family XIII bacterium]